MTIEKKRRYRDALLAALPFLVLLMLYEAGSWARLEANSHDKLMPALSTMALSFWHLASTIDGRTGRYILFDDWTSSVMRIGLGCSAATATALAVGIATGTNRTLRRVLGPVIRSLSIIPPLALLPILFVTLGIAEVGKDGLIYLGIVWTMIREIERAVAVIAPAASIKARTLGSTGLQFIRYVILPQALPRLLASLRQHLPAAWLFLIAAEAISAESGLGYRIFLVRRYMAMDLIVPYTLVITMTGYLADRALATAARILFPWDGSMKDGE